jgi:hypothetical protein
LSLFSIPTSSVFAALSDRASAAAHKFWSQESGHASALHAFIRWMALHNDIFGTSSVEDGNHLAFDISRGAYMPPIVYKLSSTTNASRSLAAVSTSRSHVVGPSYARTCIIARKPYPSTTLSVPAFAHEPALTMTGMPTYGQEPVLESEGRSKSEGVVLARQGSQAGGKSESRQPGSSIVSSTMAVRVSTPSAATSSPVSNASRVPGAVPPVETASSPSLSLVVGRRVPVQGDKSAPAERQTPSFPGSAQRTARTVAPSPAGVSKRGGRGGGARRPPRGRGGSGR